MVGIVLGRIQTGARTAGKVDPVGRIVQFVIDPVSKGLTGAMNGTSDFFAGLARSRALVAENRRLKAERAQLALYLETVDRLEREIDSLRKLQNLPGLQGRKKIPAEVIGYFPNENRLTLSVGSRDGVEAGQPVVAPEGLLGRIQVVSGSTSQVLLLSSPDVNNRIGAIALRNPPSVGLLRGESPTSYFLEFADPKAPVDVGDVVMTSGLSDRIPRGIPIGRVIQIDDSEELGRRQALVFPSVSVGSVREVEVIE